MTIAKLRDFNNLDEIGRACGVAPEFIEGYASSSNQSGYYKIIKIPKRGKKRQGEYRVVFKAYQHDLTAFHRHISMFVSNSTNYGKHVQGFLKKRSTQSNARQHLGAPILLHADIKGFFDAISTAQIQKALVQEGIQPTLASTLASACTIDGLLRQGTRCSPALANLVCHDMDQAFLKLAKSHNCVYTRYADNLTFSGENVASDDSVRYILECHGFQLRDSKCYRQYSGQSQYVTGLTVSDSIRPRLPRRLKHRLRMTMHYIEKYGLTDHWKHIDAKDHIREEVWLEGMLSFANSVEPALAVPWRKILSVAMANRSSNDSDDNLFDDF